MFNCNIQPPTTMKADLLNPASVQQESHLRRPTRINMNRCGTNLHVAGPSL